MRRCPKTRKRPAEPCDDVVVVDGVIHQTVTYNGKEYTYCDGKKTLPRGHGCAHGFGRGVKGLFVPWLNASIYHFDIVAVRPCEHCLSVDEAKLRLWKGKLLKCVTKELERRIKEINEEHKQQLLEHDKPLHKAKVFMEQFKRGVK